MCTKMGVTVFMICGHLQKSLLRARNQHVDSEMFACFITNIVTSHLGLVIIHEYVLFLSTKGSSLCLVIYRPMAFVFLPAS